MAVRILRMGLQPFVKLRAQAIPTRVLAVCGWRGSTDDLCAIQRCFGALRKTEQAIYIALLNHLLGSTIQGEFDLGSGATGSAPSVAPLGRTTGWGEYFGLAACLARIFVTVSGMLTRASSSPPATSPWVNRASCHAISRVDDLRKLRLRLDRFRTTETVQSLDDKHGTGHDSAFVRCREERAERSLFYVALVIRRQTLIPK